MGQYSKIGVGTVLSVAGITDNLGSHLNIAEMYEGMYRRLENINPETILTARRTLETVIEQNFRADWPTMIGVAVGVALVASGIYNLAKNYRTETRE